MFTTNQADLSLTQDHPQKYEVKREAVSQPCSNYNYLSFLKNFIDRLIF